MAFELSRHPPSRKIPSHQQPRTGKLTPQDGGSTLRSLMLGRTRRDGNSECRQEVGTSRAFGTRDRGGGHRRASFRAVHSRPAVSGAQPGKNTARGSASSLHWLTTRFILMATDPGVAALCRAVSEVNSQTRTTATRNRAYGLKIRVPGRRSTGYSCRYVVFGMRPPKPAPLR
jgi:hypothetical protein